MSKCKLCLKDKKLCKSHIYPEYMYANTYDTNHSFIEFSANDKSFNKKRRKGIYQKLLCLDCETIIQGYEDYGKFILYDTVKPFMRKNNTHFSTSEYDYKKFKLYILSLLWRASICSLEGFKGVDLGPYEEKLRTALINQETLKVNNYPCLILQTKNGPSLADGVFMEMYPRKVKKDQKTIYQGIIDGLFLLIGVGVCSIDTFPKGSSVSPDFLRIGYDELTKLSDFIDLFDRLEKQNKFSVYKKTIQNQPK